MAANGDVWGRVGKGTIWLLDRSNPGSRSWSVSGARGTKAGEQQSGGSTAAVTCRSRRTTSGRSGIRESSGVYLTAVAAGWVQVPTSGTFTRNGVHIRGGRGHPGTAEPGRGRWRIVAVGRNRGRLYTAAMAEKILIVEDRAELASFVSMYLKNARYQVEIARDGGEALQKAENAKPDLVVLDLMLPTSTGSRSAAASGRAPTCRS